MWVSSLYEKKSVISWLLFPRGDVTNKTHLDALVVDCWMQLSSGFDSPYAVAPIPIPSDNNFLAPRFNLCLFISKNVAKTVCQIY